MVICSFKQIRSSVDHSTADSVALALVSSHLDHVNSILSGSVVTKAVDAETETKTGAAGFETEAKTEAVASETEAKTEAVYLKTEAEAQGSWPILLTVLSSGAVLPQKF